ncbi:MAG: helix-turn-helix domain-containing protein [Chloroflexi bacterium]|nr:helix-turn-helix domain-containing protein [Chloroflexota bacterium]
MAVARVPAAEEYLSTAEAAQLIGIHPNTLRGYADQRLIEHIRLPGGHRRFPRRAVEAFIARLRDRMISEPTEEQMTRLLREHGE